jgi:hypothetical protein
MLQTATRQPPHLQQRLAPCVVGLVENAAAVGGNRLTQVLWWSAQVGRHKVSGRTQHSAVREKATGDATADSGGPDGTRGV